MILETLIIMTLVGGAVVYFADILTAMQQHKVHAADYGLLIRTKLWTGNYKVVGQVFGNRFLGIYQPLRYKDEWKVQPSGELDQLFGGEESIRIPLRG